MSATRAASVCLISISGPWKRDWRAAFAECVEAAGLQPVDYAAGAVDDASCLLAFAPGGEEEVLYQAAYAMGRDVPVLMVVSRDEDLSRFEPKPLHVLEISPSTPNPLAEVQETIKETLTSIALNRSPSNTRAPRDSRPSAERKHATAGMPVSTVGQAEALLEAFLADGLSERLIHRLLLEAGCRESWVEFRLQRQFGGW